MNSDIKKDFTTGSILKHLISYAAPLLFANVLQICYGVADMIIVGHAAGSTGTAAIGIGSEVMIVITAACTGLCTGGTVILSQCKGAGDEEGILQIIGTFMSAVFLIAIIISVTGVVLSPVIINLLNTPSEAVPQASEYLKMSCAGVAFIFGYNTVCAILRGLGNSRYPMYFVAAAVVLNIILDMIFVMVLKMNAPGAALATVISQGLAFIAAVAFLLKSKEVFDGIRLKHFLISGTRLAMILKIGIPSMFQTLFVHISMLVIAMMINSYGVIAAAANSVGSRISNFFLLPRQAVSFAVAGIVGQNMGAGQPERAERSVKIGAGLSVMLSVVLFIIINVFPDLTISIFNNSPDVIKKGTVYIHIVSLSYLFLAPMTVYNNLAIGVGKSFLAMFNSFMDSVIVRIPLCFLLMRAGGLGIKGIYIGMALSPVAALILSWRYFYFGKWREINVFRNHRK